MKHEAKALVKNEFLLIFKQSSFYVSVFLITFLPAFSAFFVNSFFTANQTVDLRVFFSSFPYIFILVIPAISFNLLKNEGYTQTLPVSTLKKIWIKFFCANALLQAELLLSLITPLFFLRFGSIDLSQFFCSLIFIQLYASMLLSLSIFIQKTIKNRISAILMLFIILIIFNTAHLLTESFPFEVKFDTLLDISFYGHFENAIKGIFSSRDLFYFATLTAIFLVFSAVVEEKQKQVKVGLKTFILLILCFFLILADTSLFESRIDLTKNKEFTLTKLSKNETHDTEKDCNITYYYSANLKKHEIPVNDIKDILIQYAKNSRNISFFADKIDGDDKPLISKLEKLGIKPQFYDEDYLYSAVTIETDSDFKVIPFVFSTESLEYLITSKLMEINGNRQKRTAVFLRNNLNLENDYSFLIPALENYGIETVILDSLDEINFLETDIPVMLIGCNELNYNEALLLQKFILENRPVLINTSANQIDVNGSWKIIRNYSVENCNLFRILENQGFFITAETCLDQNCEKLNLQNGISIEKLDYPFWIKSDKYTFFWPSAIESNGVQKINQSINTGNEGYLAENTENIDTNPFSARKIIINPRTVGVHGLISSSQDKKLIVVSDQYFTSNLMNYTASYKNLDITVDQVLELNGAGELIPVKNKTVKDLSFTKIHNEEELNSCKIITVFSCMIFWPVFTAAVSVLSFIFARKKYKKRLIK